MNPIDGTVGHVLTEAEVAAAIAGPGAISVRANVGPVRPAVVAQPVPEPTPEPLDDGRPLAELEADATAARTVVNELLERSLRVAEQIEALDRRIEAGRAVSHDPATTAADRAERARLVADLAEVDTLRERASAVHDRAAAVATAGQQRAKAAELRGQLADLAERAAASDAAIETIIGALLDLEDARAALVAEAEAVVDGLNSLPERHWTGPARWVGGVRQRPTHGEGVPAAIRFDRQRIPELARPSRPRRLILGL